MDCITLLILMDSRFLDIFLCRFSVRRRRNRLNRKVLHAQIHTCSETPNVEPDTRFASDIQIIIQADVFELRRLAHVCKTGTALWREARRDARFILQGDDAQANCCGRVCPADGEWVETLAGRTAESTAVRTAAAPSTL